MLTLEEQVRSDLERLKSSRESLVQDLQELVRQEAEIRKAIVMQEGGIAYATHLLEQIEAREAENNGVLIGTDASGIIPEGEL